MSVLIRGMKIPDKCGHCRFATAFECEVTKNFITTFNIRQSDCPLVPVPPHGRCVDADKLMQEMRLFVKENMLSRDDARELLETIEGAPTIIPAEEGE